MITRASRDLARYSSSKVFWRNDRVAIVQIDSWKLAIKEKKAESNNKFTESPRK